MNGQCGSDSLVRTSHNMSFCFSRYTKLHASARLQEWWGDRAYAMYLVVLWCVWKLCQLRDTQRKYDHPTSPKGWHSHECAVGRLTSEWAGWFRPSCSNFAHNIVLYFAPCKAWSVKAHEISLSCSVLKATDTFSRPLSV